MYYSRVIQFFFLRVNLTKTNQINDDNDDEMSYIIHHKKVGPHCIKALYVYMYMYM